ncbi:MAG: nucleotidyltransferase domain-containing protein [Dehalococcoidia bacterium]|nr:nucleotidyltransferase domain-containing protein [Dehalococcoidia bacterium]
MLGPHLISTVNQKVLSLLVKFSDREFYEREVARRLGISAGAANRALNGLFSSGAVRRRREGRMYFYSVDPANPVLTGFKKMVNIALIEPLVEDLKAVSNRVVLYGSCAQGTDTSESDMDLFVVSNNRDDASGAVGDFTFPKGFEDVRIQAVIRTPVELLAAGEAEQAFMDEVEQGIVLWERGAGEPGV